MQISKNIRQARVTIGKTQQEMADLVGVKRTTYASWEKTVIPDVLSLIKLGEIFSMDWTSLVKETITGAPIKSGTRNSSAIKRIDKNTEDTRAMVEEILSKLNDDGKGKN